MKCQSCGNEAVTMQGHVITEASGPESALTLVRGGVLIDVCDVCAVNRLNNGWELLCFERREAPVIIKPIIKPEPPKPLNLERCVGCRWRVPHEFGGEGIICREGNGACPDWAVQWVMRYSTHKSTLTEEDILEKMRL